MNKFVKIGDIFLDILGILDIFDILDVLDILDILYLNNKAL